MRSYDPKDKYDVGEADRLNAEPWMLKLLRMNPDYNCWGPGEDYMSTRENKGWATSVIVETWADCEFKELNDLNEVVNFHFRVHRDSEACEACHESGYGPKAYQVSEDFYDFAGAGRRWCDQITLDECQALVKEHRLSRYDQEKKQWVPHAPIDQSFCDLVNRANGYRLTDEDKASGHVAGLLGGLNHDAINRCILIEARCKRLGYTLRCKACKGDGILYTSDTAHVGLVLWVLHPRKGCSRGVEIKRIDRSELPEVFAYLKTAADRNAKRFARVVKAAAG